MSYFNVLTNVKNISGFDVQKVSQAKWLGFSIFSFNYCVVFSAIVSNSTVELLGKDSAC